MKPQRHWQCIPTTVSASQPFDCSTNQAPPISSNVLPAADKTNSRVSLLEPTADSCSDPLITQETKCAVGGPDCKWLAASQRGLVTPVDRQNLQPLLVQPAYFISISSSSHTQLWHRNLPTSHLNWTCCLAEGQSMNENFWSVFKRVL